MKYYHFPFFQINWSNFRPYCQLLVMSINFLSKLFYRLFYAKNHQYVLSTSSTSLYVADIRPLYHRMCSDSALQSNAYKYLKSLTEFERLTKSCFKTSHTLNNDIPGCFFTGTSLPKSSNNLEPICNYVNVKCSWLVILRIISVTSRFTLWETYATKCEPHKLESNNFPIPLHLTDYAYILRLCCYFCN